MKSFLCKVLLVFVLFFPGHAHALTSGSSTGGSLGQGDTAYYSFSGTAGQAFRLFAQSDDYAVRIKILKPDDTELSTSFNRAANTLPDTGTYDVEITAQHTTQEGDFTLYYVRGDDSVSSGTIQGGQHYTGTLAENEIKSYQFEGEDGQGFRLYGDSNDYPVAITIFRPDGSERNITYDRFAGELTQTGTYSVAIYAYDNNQEGDYRFDFVLGGEDEDAADGDIKSGTSINKTLETNQLHSFEFDGETDQEFRLSAEADNDGYAVGFTLFNPDGSVVNTTYHRWSGALTQTGKYIVAVYAYTKNDEGPYRLDFVLGADNVTEGYLLNGDTRPGELLENGMTSYKISGTASQSLSVTSTGSYTRSFRLYKPDGSLWKYSNASAISGTMPDTGIYTLVTYFYNRERSGGYTVSLSAAAPNVPPTDAEKESCPTGNCSKKISKKVGDSIDVDVGYKQQVVTDYNAGGLNFTRTYRSDSTWTDNTMGALWRHNYARSLSVSAGSTAEITDGTGGTTSYSWVSSEWVPDDPNTVATFETDGSEFIYTLPDGTVEIYDSNELLTRIEYLGGGALNLTYNGSDQLIEVENENGRSLTLTYSSGRVATVVTPDGTFTYSYDVDGNLDEVEKPDTNTIEYHYEDTNYDNALTGITDEEGNRVTTYAYDANGLATRSEYAGNVSDYDVSYSTNSSTVTNALGKDFTYHFQNFQDVRQVIQIDGASTTNTAAATRYFNYDDNGWLIGETDWEGNITRYQYNDDGNVTKIQEAFGTAEERETTITWNNDFNLPELITEPGKTTDYDYDTYGRMTSMTVTDTATSESRTTTYTYFSNTTDGSGNTILGRLKKIDGPRTDVTDTTEFTYDANLDLDTITNALSQVIEITARDSAGRVTTFEDVNDVETDLVYDSNGWLESSTVAPGTALEAETSYDYDANGNLTKVTLGNGVFLEYSYDNAQRLTGIEDSLGNTVEFTLDNAGNITQTDYNTATPTLKYTHDQVFDELSRIIESVGAATQTAEFDYDTNSDLTKYTDPNTNETDYTYDALRRVVDATDALSGVTTLSYDDLGHLTDVEDERDNTTTYTYNAFGDVTGETSPNRGSISYTVDKAGNVTQMTDARSVVTNYTYDALNRLTDVEYPSDSSLDAELTWDDNPDTAGACGTSVGRLCRVDDAAGVTDYKYNNLGQLIEVKETRGALTFTTEYEYDLAGNVTKITLPSGREIDYTRNANGQVTQVDADVASTSTTLASSITYLPFGPMDGLTYGNSLTFSATYDQDYYLTNRTVSGSIYNHTYDTDANGNITQIGGTDYAYDELNRLEQEDDGSTIDYTYDATDNRLTRVEGSTVTTTVPSGSNKISAVGSDSYTYDNAGNITDDDTYEYTWDAANRLEEIELSGTSTNVGSYTYNTFSQRATKTVSSVTTHYVYGLGGKLYGEYDSSGDLIREYVYLNNEPLAQIDDGSPEVLTYLHTDHLGTPKFGTNSGGTQVWSWAPDAFGIGAPSGSVTVNLRMPGQYYDDESGLHYNWNRYYNPAIGRYITSDPIGLEGGINTYNYARVSPLMFIDPEGTCPCGNPENAISIARDDDRDWGINADRTDINQYFGPRTYKCNLFVDSTYEAAGYNLPNVGGSPLLGFLGRYPPGAASLSDRDYEVPGWPVVDGPALPGDLIANEGHVGIVTEGPGGTIEESPDGGMVITEPGTTISATPGGVVENDFGFRDGDEDTSVIRRCTCP